MDRLDAMRLFTRVVERRSFTQAANDIGRAALDRHAGRFTSSRRGSACGCFSAPRAWCARRSTAKPITGAASRFSTTSKMPKARSPARSRNGMLRIEVQGTLARHFLMPGLPEFFAATRRSRSSMSESDRWVDLVQEGVDCALRYGKLRDSELVARPVAMLERVTCATPAYIERCGRRPKSNALAGHRMVGIRASTTGNLDPLEFTDGEQTKAVTLPCAISVTGTESFLTAIRLGLGLAQVPRFHVEQDLKAVCSCSCSSTCRSRRCRSRWCISARGSCRRGCAYSSIGPRGNSRSDRPRRRM